MIITKSFKYKTKLIESTGNGILENATISVPLKYLSNFWELVEMPFINWKVESKLRWTKYFVLVTGPVDNTNANPNNSIFTIQDTKLYVQKWEQEHNKQV